MQNLVITKIKISFHNNYNKKVRWTNGYYKNIKYKITI